MSRRKKTIEEVWAADDITILRLHREGRDVCYIAKRVPLSWQEVMEIISVYEHTRGFNPRTDEFMLDKLYVPRKNRRKK
jgi:hypothetical protein